jgi:hypothetical protein
MTASRSISSSTPELTKDQNEERWWIHHWGLVRQDMRASYLGVSDQVIDGPMHDVYRAHHHDRHDPTYLRTFTLNSI